MISERQHEANRRNAAKSHGPTTPEGRAAVRINALKHGLTAADVILPTVEEKIDFEEFRLAFEEECQPVGLIEQILVEDMVTARWRMNRVRKMEPGFFAFRREELKSWISHFPTLDAQAHLAMIVHNDAERAGTLGKMSRYEARFERSFYKALKELQRLQAIRATVSDSGNGTVSQDPVSPDSDPPNPPPPSPETVQPQAYPEPPITQASARGTDPAPPTDTADPEPEATLRI